MQGLAQVFCRSSGAAHGSEWRLFLKISQTHMPPPGCRPESSSANAASVLENADSTTPAVTKNEDLLASDEEDPEVEKAVLHCDDVRRDTASAPAPVASSDSSYSSHSSSSSNAVKVSGSSEKSTAQPAQPAVSENDRCGTDDPAAAISAVTALPKKMLAAKSEAKSKAKPYFSSAGSRLAGIPISEREVDARQVDSTAWLRRMQRRVEAGAKMPKSQQQLAGRGPADPSMPCRPGRVHLQPHSKMSTSVNASASLDHGSDGAAPPPQREYDWRNVPPLNLLMETMTIGTNATIDSVASYMILTTQHIVTVVLSGDMQRDSVVVQWLLELTHKGDGSLAPELTRRVRREHALYQVCRRLFVLLYTVKVSVLNMNIRTMSQSGVDADQSLAVARGVRQMPTCALCNIVLRREFSRTSSFRFAVLDLRSCDLGATECSWYGKIIRDHRASIVTGHFATCPSAVALMFRNAGATCSPIGQWISRASNVIDLEEEHTKPSLAYATDFHPTYFILLSESKRLDTPGLMATVITHKAEVSWGSDIAFDFQPCANLPSLQTETPLQQHGAPTSATNFQVKVKPNAFHKHPLGCFTQRVMLGEPAHGKECQRKRQQLRNHWSGHTNSLADGDDGRRRPSTRDRHFRQSPDRDHRRQRSRSAHNHRRHVSAHQRSRSRRKRHHRSRSRRSRGSHHHRKHRHRQGRSRRSRGRSRCRRSRRRSRRADRNSSATKQEEPKKGDGKSCSDSSSGTKKGDGKSCNDSTSNSSSSPETEHKPQLLADPPPGDTQRHAQRTQRVQTARCEFWHAVFKLERELWNPQ